MLVRRPPLAALPMALALLACSGDGPAAPPVDPSATPPPVLAMASGDGQEGKTGEPLAQPFVVRVTDERGAPAVNASVLWDVRSGSGRFVDDYWGPIVTSTANRTEATGLARVTFMPHVLGTSTVTARLSLSDSPSVTFAAEATAVLISNWNWGYFGDVEGSLEIEVPVGTPVEWVNYYGPVVRVMSTSAPPGSEWFEGTLGKEERLTFVPQVAGTWKWAWDYLDDAPEGELASWHVPILTAR